MSQKIHIIGTGGLSKELIGFIASEKHERYSIIGCWGPENFNNVEYQAFYKGTDEDLKKVYKKGEKLIIAVTSPQIKKQIFHNFSEDIYAFETYIHPTVEISEYSKIGIGTIIGPKAIITGDAVVNNFVYVSYASIVGHDSVVDSFSTLYPFVEVCGDCNVGKECIFGIRSILLPSNSVGDNTKIDAGSILRKSIEGNCLVSGNPAVVVKRY